MINHLNNLKNLKYFRYLIYFLLTSYFILLFLLFTRATFLINDNQNQGANDFLAYYSGAEIIRKEPIKLYNFETQYKIQEKILNIAPNTYLEYNYPPVAAYIFIPFTVLDFETANVIWVIFNFTLLAIFLIFIFFYFKNYNWWIRIGSILAIMTFPPMVMNVGHGQIALLLGILFLLSWYFYKKNKDFLSGLLLSVYFIKLQYLPLIFLVLIFHRNLKMLFGFLTGILTMLAISFYATGPRGILNYANHLSQFSDKTNEFSRNIKYMTNIYSVLNPIFQKNTDLLLTIYILFVFLISILVIYVWFFKIKKTSYATNLRWAILAIAILLISPHTNNQDLILILIALIILIPQNIHKFTKISRRLKFYIITFIPITYLFINSNIYARTLFVTYLLSFLVICSYEVIKVIKKGEKNKNQKQITSGT